MDPVSNNNYVSGQNSEQDIQPLAKKQKVDTNAVFSEKVEPHSQTAQILKKYPQVREIIDLAFRASAPGPTGEAAFTAFQNHPYFAN